MLAGRLARIPLTTFVTTLGKPSGLLPARPPSVVVRAQQYASRVRPIRTQKPSFKEKAFAPAGAGAFNVGRGVMAGASVVGMGALCFYGLGMSNEVGAIDKSVLWSETVRHRIRATYMYFGGSLVFTAASAVALSRSPRFMAIVSQGGWKVLLGSVAAMWGSGILCQSLPYKEGLGAKQLAWMLHSGVVGAVIAPLAMLGGPLLVRAAVYTAGVVGGLSTLAVCAPSDKFLNMGGPLAMGLGVVFMSSIGTWFLPPTTALGAGLYSVAIYGGVVLFGMFLLYDTQKIMYRAENHPTYATVPFDPINNSVGIYLDTINIFMRIAMILAGGNKRK